MTSIVDIPVSGQTDLAAELRVARVRPLRGPNYWRLAPVIACDVHLGRLERMATTALPEFTERLITALPSLH